MCKNPFNYGVLLLSLSVSLMDQAMADEPTSTSSRILANLAIADANHHHPAKVIYGPRESHNNHPLAPTLQLARQGYQRINESVHDYTCTMVKRERVNGVLNDPETIFAKVRHEPSNDADGHGSFSLYMRFESPANVQGREILLQAADDDNRMLVRKGGKGLAFLTAKLDPACPLAMRGNLYPVTEFGLKRMVERMIELGEKELPYEECEVSIDDSCKFDNKSCTRIEVCHPVRRDHFKYHLVRIYIDNELQLPIRFESYDWPVEGSDKPLLKEEYTYGDLKLNVNLSDADFDSTNPEYKFRVRD